MLFRSERLTPPVKIALSAALVSDKSPALPPIHVHYNDISQRFAVVDTLEST